MAIQVVEFSNGGYKIRKIFASESAYSNTLWQEKWGAPTFCMKMLKTSYNLGSIFKKNWFPTQKLKTCI